MLNFICNKCGTANYSNSDSNSNSTQNSNSNSDLNTNSCTKCGKVHKRFNAGAPMTSRYKDRITKLINQEKFDI